MTLLATIVHLENYAFQKSLRQWQEYDRAFSISEIERMIVFEYLNTVETLS